jgi:hypothetical protein
MDENEELDADETDWDGPGRRRCRVCGRTKLRRWAIDFGPTLRGPHGTPGTFAPCPYHPQG